MIKIENISKLQEIRAVQALTDLEIKIHINPSDEPKFSLLKTYFGMSYNFKTINGSICLKDIVYIDHSTPKTSITTITKPLIFSKKILLNLKSKWPENRSVFFSFCGLITEKRKATIENWMYVHFNKIIHLKKENRTYKIIRKILNAPKLNHLMILKYDKLQVWSSNRGRNFPVKSWDAEYYKYLLKSKFVLCPSGDYIWTYRFFESIMCGAIPIVEESCTAYNGFKFYYMKDSMSNIAWSPEIAIYNFNLCMERLTLTTEEATKIRYNLKKLALINKIEFDG